MSTNRLESFSDGVIAVAITLLVLNLTVPSPTAHIRLAHELGNRWPSYAAYATSFITIGIIWINHHVMIGRLRETDHMILILNLLLLLSIGLIPFATDLIATYLREGRGQNLAAAIYGGTLLAMGIAFATLNGHILLRKSHMLRGELPRERRLRILARSWSGLVPYAIATGLAPLSPYMTISICAALAVYYALPIASGTERTG